MTVVEIVMLSVVLGALIAAPLIMWLSKADVYNTYKEKK